MQDFWVDIVNSPNASISFGIVIDVVDSHSGKHIPKSPDFRFRFSMSHVVYDISPLPSSYYLRNRVMDSCTFPGSFYNFFFQKSERVFKTSLTITTWFMNILHVLMHIKIQHAWYES